jgi:hypothetical protein
VGETSFSLEEIFRFLVAGVVVTGIFFVMATEEDGLLVEAVWTVLPSAEPSVGWPAAWRAEDLVIL